MTGARAGTGEPRPRDEAGRAVAADLIAVLVAVTGGAPRVMTVRGGTGLPSGPFEHRHRSLQFGLRAWVEEQTGLPLGYVEQLYTFADRDRTTGDDELRVISISYLGLAREEAGAGAGADGWRDWYDYFPWEDHRAGAPALIAEAIAPALDAWAKDAGRAGRAERARRAALAFGRDGDGWNEEWALQRYELLYEAGLVAEAARDGRPAAGPLVPGRAMESDHRRILATGIARLRAKIKYRPVVFELMPPAFTLLQLQRSVEALAGRGVHKQNFRRLMEQQDLVEETGATATDTGGRPAKLFRFRHAVLAERAVAGTKLPLARG
ncbi:NUDIX hydrolase [Azorhizobium doebereinerae]|uniref:NUDIX hydrolase n=1 Tax=Azorhizobium doebereinerae TaxID=281091 RepID=UPI000421E699|nr:membrane protein [Azorhizobium doebereinerae]